MGSRHAVTMQGYQTGADNLAFMPNNAYGQQSQPTQQHGNVQMFTPTFTPSEMGGGMGDMGGMGMSNQAAMGNMGGMGSMGNQGAMGTMGALGYGSSITGDDEDYENEPPLLEELGINFDHIYTKTFLVLHPLKEMDEVVINDSGMA